ncbi:carbohydrate kinase family protein [Stenotrophobium rhamnosiphilum]|uniref:Carbohydrate kinase n=1 Tax=Stenotrophobium rhamnosiphilum TaxID=2029166 RepID=A0A2T5MH42_9GAMM|nr:carbohydrate kinase [Stenotrophobium rhamnosiphilum]PTU31898.1 carbohydrate kinase [Stenotrophobium rhamnosiphilum]
MTTITKSLPRLVVLGEALTDFVRTGDQSWTSVAGGACWNVARVTGTLGIATAWAGAISDDFLGEEILEKSRTAHLDLRFIQKVSKPPLIAMVHETAPPKYFFLGNDSADLAFDEKKLPAGWEDACQIAHFGCISLVRQPLGEKLVGIARDLKRRGVRISYDPNYRNVMGPTFSVQFEEMAKLADIIKLSDEDLAQIYPNTSSEASLKRVREISPLANILFTRGASGLALLTPTDSFEQPAFIVTVADTVGAGDASIGGFISSLLLEPKQDLAHHLRFSAATAAAACTHTGAHAPTHKQVLDLMQS